PHVLAFALLIALTFLLALAPPVAYDSLIYHLSTPKEMLLQHGLLLTEYGSGNLPLVPQMLYLIGLVFGSPVLANLLHFRAGARLGWGVWLFAARWGGALAGTIALAALLTIRTTSALAAIAYIDLFCGLWEVLGIFALALWTFPTRAPAGRTTA